MDPKNSSSSDQPQTPVVTPTVPSVTPESISTPPITQVPPSNPNPPASATGNKKGALMVLSLVILGLVLGGVWYTKVSQPQTINSEAAMKNKQKVVTIISPTIVPTLTEEDELQAIDVGDTASDFADINKDLQGL